MQTWKREKREQQQKNCTSGWVRKKGKRNYGTNGSPLLLRSQLDIWCLHRMGYTCFAFCSAFSMYAWKTHHHESFMECNVITNDLKCNAPSAHSFAWYFLFSDPINAFIHIIIYCCVCWQPERRSAICHAMANECVHRRMNGVLFSYNAFYSWKDNTNSFRGKNAHKFLMGEKWTSNRAGSVGKIENYSCVLHGNFEIQYGMRMARKVCHIYALHVVRGPIFSENRWYLLRSDLLSVRILHSTFYSIHCLRADFANFPNNMMFCCIYNKHVNCWQTKTQQLKCG